MPNKLAGMIKVCRLIQSQFAKGNDAAEKKRINQRSERKGSSNKLIAITGVINSINEKRIRLFSDPASFQMYTSIIKAETSQSSA